MATATTAEKSPKQKRQIYGAGTNRRLMGTFITKSIGLQHPAIPPVAKRYEQFDNAAQYVFGYACNVLANTAKKKQWGKEIDTVLEGAIKYIETETQRITLFYEQHGFSAAESFVKKDFELAVQSPYSSRLIDLLEMTDRYFMLMDGLYIARACTEEEHGIQINNGRKFINAVVNKIVEMQRQIKIEVDASIAAKDLAPVPDSQSSSVAVKSKSKPRKSPAVAVSEASAPPAVAEAA